MVIISTSIFYHISKEKSRILQKIPITNINEKYWKKL
jgi:hypothetical protein